MRASKDDLVEEEDLLRCQKFFALFLSASDAGPSSASSEPQHHPSPVHSGDVALDLHPESSVH